MKKIILVTAVVLGLSSGAYAFNHSQEQCGKGEHKFMGKEKMHSMQAEHRYKGFQKRHSILAKIRENMKELNLTFEQKGKIRSIMQEKREKMRALRVLKGQKPQVNLSNFMSTTEFNKEAFKTEMAKVQATRMAQNSKIREQRVEMIADTLSKIFNVLTPEQREKLIQLSKK